MTLASLKLPKHVRAIQWAPQNDILAHTGTKVFVTHGGANSVYEAAYHGIPIVALPIAAEQPHNAAKVTSGTASFQLCATVDQTKGLVLDLVLQLAVAAGQPYVKLTRRLHNVLHGACCLQSC